MGWKKLLESAKESLNDHLRLRNDYLVAENRILRNQIDGRVQLTDSERKELAEIGVKLGKKALAEIATLAQPETILAWNRKFANPKVDPCESPKSVGRPRVDKEIEDWVFRMPRENHSWGYDRIQGSLNHLGYTISDQTVDNLLKRHGISPAPSRKKTVTWWEFVRSHLNVLVATDFFNSDVWSRLGSIIFCLLSFLHFGRQLFQSVKMTLHQRTQQAGSFVRHALNKYVHLQGVNYWIKTVARSCAVYGVEGLPYNSLSAFTPNQPQQPQEPRAHDMDNVVVLPVVRSRQIRDGPMPSRQRFPRWLENEKRKAA